MTLRLPPTPTQDRLNEVYPRGTLVLDASTYELWIGDGDTPGGVQPVAVNDADPGGGTSDHGALTGLTDDDHTQYHNDTRGDARYYTQAQVDSAIVTDHGALTGLGDDDHTQYLLADGSRALSSDWDNTGRRVRNMGVAEVVGSAPGTPATGLVWLDTSVSSSLLGTVAVNSVTTTYTALATDTVILCNATSGAFTVTLLAASNSGKVLYVKKTDSSVNAVTVDGASSETIDDATTAVLTTQYESIQIVSDGTEWWIL